MLWGWDSEIYFITDCDKKKTKKTVNWSRWFCLFGIIVNRDNRKCPHVNDLTELMCSSILVFLLNCLSWSPWLDEHLAHCISCKNKWDRIIYKYNTFSIKMWFKNSLMSIGEMMWIIIMLDWIIVTLNRPMSVGFDLMGSVRVSWWGSSQRCQRKSPWWDVHESLV